VRLQGVACPVVLNVAGDQCSGLLRQLEAGGAARHNQRRVWTQPAIPLAIQLRAEALDPAPLDVLVERGSGIGMGQEDASLPAALRDRGFPGSVRPASVLEEKKKSEP